MEVKYICSKCKTSDVDLKAWIKINMPTNELVFDKLSILDSKNAWCNYCNRQCTVIVEKRRFLFIAITVQDGENTHDHRVTYLTSGDNINFAAERYVAKYYGFGERQMKNCGDKETWYFHGGTIAAKLHKVVEVDSETYRKLNELFY